MPPETAMLPIELILAVAFFHAIFNEANLWKRLWISFVLSIGIISCFSVWFGIRLTNSPNTRPDILIFVGMIPCVIAFLFTAGTEWLGQFLSTRTAKEISKTN